MAMQGPRGDEAIQGLDAYEQMVDNFAEEVELDGEEHRIVDAKDILGVVER